MNLEYILEMDWSGLVDEQNTTKSTDSQIIAVISDQKFSQCCVEIWGSEAGHPGRSGVDLLGLFQIHPQDGTKSYPEAKLPPSFFPWSFSQGNLNTPSVRTKLLQSCLTFCDPLDCSPPGSSVHGILQARIPKWVAISSPRGSFPSMDQTRISFVSFIGRQVLYCLLGNPISTFNVLVSSLPLPTLNLPSSQFTQHIFTRSLLCVTSTGFQNQVTGYNETVQALFPPEPHSVGQKMVSGFKRAI